MADPSRVHGRCLLAAVAQHACRLTMQRLSGGPSPASCTKQLPWAPQLSGGGHTSARQGVPGQAGTRVSSGRRCCGASRWTHVNGCWKAAVYRTGWMDAVVPELERRADARVCMSYVAPAEQTAAACRPLGSPWGGLLLEWCGHCTAKCLCSSEMAAQYTNDCGRALAAVACPGRSRKRGELRPQRRRRHVGWGFEGSTHISSPLWDHLAEQHVAVQAQRLYPPRAN